MTIKGNEGSQVPWETQFTDPFLTQSRRWSSPVIQSSDPVFHNSKMLQSTIWPTLFCWLPWKPLYIFIMSHPKTLNNTLGQYIRNHSLLTKHIFLCEKEIQIFGFLFSFGLHFICFDVVSPFTVFAPSLMQRITQETGEGELLCNARNRGVNLEYDFPRSSGGWEWSPWVLKQYVFVANMWQNRGFLWGCQGRKGGQKRGDLEFMLEVNSYLIVIACGLPVLSS